MKMSLKLTLVLSLLLVSSPLTSASCNGTIAECFDGDEEYMMESDISRRVLASQNDPVTDVSKLKGNTLGANCGRPKYANCLPNANGQLSQINCKAYNRCRLGNK